MNKNNSNKSVEAKFKVTGKLWIYPGIGAWHFLSVNKKLSNDIKLITSHLRRGFGSVKVSVQIGNSKWTTSIFPTKEGEYLLPIKRVIRTTEDLREGKTTTAILILL